MLWSLGLGSAGARFEVGQHQTGLAARSAKKCRGGFLPRILGWEHSIPYLSPIPSPPRGRKTEEEITWCSYTQNTSTLLRWVQTWTSLLLDFMSSPFLPKSDPLALSLGHCLGLSLSFTYYFCLFLTPFPLQRHFFSCPLCAGVCMCESQRARLEAAVVVWSVVRHWFTDVQSIMT